MHSRIITLLNQADTGYKWTAESDQGSHSRYRLYANGKKTIFIYDENLTYKMEAENNEDYTEEYTKHIAHCINCNTLDIFDVKNCVRHDQDNFPAQKCH